MRLVFWLLVLAQGQPIPEDSGPFRPINGEIVRETPHFRIFAENGFVPVDLDWLQAQV